MIKSVASFLLLVKDPKASLEFYKRLGFIPHKEDESSTVVRLNWFTITFLDQTKTQFPKEAEKEPKGAGIYINISVDHIDDYYKDLVEKGFKPSHEPKDWPWGNREFALRDPDGYQLVFFEKK